MQQNLGCPRVAIIYSPSQATYLYPSPRSRQVWNKSTCGSVYDVVVARRFRLESTLPKSQESSARSVYQGCKHSSKNSHFAFRNQESLTKSQNCLPSMKDWVKQRFNAFSESFPHFFQTSVWEFLSPKKSLNFSLGSCLKLGSAISLIIYCAFSAVQLDSSPVESAKYIPNKGSGAPSSGSPRTS